MKTIVSRKFDKPETDTVSADWYHQIWYQLLETPANGQGADVAEIRRVMPILESMDKQLGAVDFREEGLEEVHLRFEDAHHEELLRRVTNGRYGRNSREMLKMIEAVENPLPETH